MSASSRRELLKRVADRYCQSSWLLKGQILDEFVDSTGYTRKHAIRLLKNGPPPLTDKPRGRSVQYGEDVKRALIVVWRTSNCLCGKRLVPFLPELVKSMERHGHLVLPAERRSQLLSLSISTVDRLLASERNPHGLSTTQPGRILRKQIAIRTHNGWADAKPGFFEADLVAHCGGSVSGSFLYTLVLTDIATGWTECVPLYSRSASSVEAAIDQISQILPFPLLGLDTDNGGEFINELLHTYCKERNIEFTRSRAYRKNDQAHVEQKNGSVVRRLVGYDRYEGVEAYEALCALYRILRLYQNYFQPSLKLVSKEREGGHITKTYDKAQTPMQRLLRSQILKAEQAKRQETVYETLDPVLLLNQLQHSQDEFWKHSRNHVGTDAQYEAAIQDETKTIVAEVINDSVLHDITQVQENDRQGTRGYRRTRKAIQKTPYRGRDDSFTDVWDPIDKSLRINPRQSAQRIFTKLQTQYPGRFRDGQLRTFVRRVAEWKQAFAEAQTIPAKASKETSK